MSTDNAQVSGTVTRGEGGDGNEEHGVGPRDGSHALGHFGGVGLLPQGTIRAFAEFGIFSKLAHIWVEGIAMTGSVYWAGRWVGSLCGMESMEVQRAVGSMFGMGFGRASDSVGQKHWQGCAVAGGDSGIIVAMGQWGNP